MSCVDACPVADTLQLEMIGGKKKINKKLVAVGVVSIFMLVTGYGMLAGKWQNDISKDEYLILYKDMDSFGHPTGTEAVKKFNDDALNKDAENKIENDNEINNSKN